MLFRTKIVRFLIAIVLFAIVWWATNSSEVIPYNHQPAPTASFKRLGILTIHTPPFYKWAPEFIRNKKRYANKHNYRLYVEHGKSDDRHPVWSKISSLIQRMKEDKHDWFWALDVDTLILNGTVKAEDFLDDQYDLIVNRDWNWFNAGSFFIKNSEWSLKYLELGENY